jgi:hypothetical protein
VATAGAAEAAAAAAAAAGGDGDALAALSRRRSALLSLPVCDVSTPRPAAGGLLSWPPGAWTASGEAPATPLAPGAHPAERGRVAALLAALAAQAAALPTSGEADAALLALLASGGGEGGGAMRGVVPWPRVVAAIRARLEHKRLLAAATDVLRRYDAYLAA